LRRWRWDVTLSAFLGLLVGAALQMLWLDHRPVPMVWPVAAIARQVDPSVVAVINQVKQDGQLKPHGLGTGVILSSTGIIVTNYHVVAGADALTVVLANGRRYPATVIGADPPTDLAVVRIAARHLTPLPLANSATVEPGELVVAIGNSLGLSHTVTAGIVSARDRALYRDGWEYHLIQTDAAINPGNSGGPLVNQDGLLIGINSSKIAQTGVEGIGFAVPSNTVRTVVEQILRFGRVQRPWIGVDIANRRSRGVGLLIAYVFPDSPAARAGIVAGDFLIAYDGRPVRSLTELIRWVAASRVGARVALGVLHGTTARTVMVELGERRPVPRAV
jgi:serine protease Do